MKRRRRGETSVYRSGKRVLDVALSGLLLCFLWLPMVGIAIAVWLTSPGGILFRQIRIGQGGKPFVCYKFRTMVADAPHDRSTAEFTDAERFVTPVGRFLRRSSLDELPQLWNVLRGEMSLIGPRPLIPREAQMHAWRQRCGVYGIRPGITGLAQICGRDRIADWQKARLDVRYARTLSFRTDCRILGMTLWRVLGGAGIGAQDPKTEKVNG